MIDLNIPRTLYTNLYHKVKFTRDDDAKLNELVERYGTNDWDTIASQMGKRKREIRERWENYLSPNIDNYKIIKQVNDKKQWKEITDKLKINQNSSSNFLTLDSRENEESRELKTSDDNIFNVFSNENENPILVDDIKHPNFFIEENDIIEDNSFLLPSDLQFDLL